MVRVVTCGDAARDQWGSRLPGAVALPGVPGAGDVDPVLDALGPESSRLVVAGDDAALAAVLQRLLRRERLDVALALLAAPGSVAARVWGLPTDADPALALARDGTARRSVLVRDDRGRPVVGRHRTGPFTGEVYADEHRLWAGDAAGLEIRPDPDATATAAVVTGPRRLAGLRAGVSSAGRGRAVQLGCHEARVEREGVPDERPISRRSWYRHTEDWWFVRS